VIADVNGLKRVNDTLGHDRGDHVLRATAGLLQRCFGALHGSLIARIGGDEFAILAPAQTLERVSSAANACCAQARSLPHGAGLSFGISAALAETPGLSVGSLFRAADQAQYRAKRTGTSAVVISGSP
jgi:diguanylate cyclase (GGDEF)-like protein